MSRPVRRAQRKTFRISYPEDDYVTQEWIDLQEDVSKSIRLAIKLAVAVIGMEDVMNLDFRDLMKFTSPAVNTTAPSVESTEKVSSADSAIEPMDYHQRNIEIPYVDSVNDMEDDLLADLDA